MAMSSVISAMTSTAAERGVPALVGVERADAHEPVHAALGLGVAVGVFALEQQRRLRDARLVAGQHILHLDREAAALGPAVVHAEEHVGPVARFGAARARLDAEDGVVAVELAAQETLQLDPVEIRGERGDRLVELAAVVFLLRRRRRPRPAPP